MPSSFDNNRDIFARPGLQATTFGGTSDGGFFSGNAFRGVLSTPPAPRSGASNTVTNANTKFAESAARVNDLMLLGNLPPSKRVKLEDALK
ncbi:hypothetical protein HDU98_001682, partial [Podochytrium sp. JEL0797]